MAGRKKEYEAPWAEEVEKVEAEPELEQALPPTRRELRRRELLSEFPDIRALVDAAVVVSKGVAPRPNRTAEYRAAKAARHAAAKAKQAGK